jgi:hypothetical protein
VTRINAAIRFFCLPCTGRLLASLAIFMSRSIALSLATARAAISQSLAPYVARQAFMGHRSIANTVVYTAVADKRIRNIWGK